MAQATISKGTGARSRLPRLKEWLGKKRIGWFLITELKNIRYLTGFGGSNGYLLVSGTAGLTESYFFTDFRYKEQSKTEVRSCEIIITKKDAIKYIIDFIVKSGAEKLAFEDTLSYRTSEMLKRKFHVKALRDTVENIRVEKDNEELGHIKNAVLRAENAFIELKPFIKAGVSERAVATMLEERLKAQGVRMLPFEIIVASGRHSAMPHARPTDKALEGGDLLIIDWGGESGGYYSDMTRTFLIGGGNDTGRKKEIYDIVLKANEKARECIRQGQTASNIDKIARTSIKEAGFGQYFGHSTGHGVGIEIHEQPYISASNRRQKITENMVFTIEPGIYIPDIGGVRIEDMVCIKGQSAETMTNLSRNLEIL